MENKNLEGTLSFEDFTEGLVAYGNCKTFGEVWEKCVGCNNCQHKEICDKLTDEYYGIKCSQVIDILLGHKKLEDIAKEVERYGRN